MPSNHNNNTDETSSTDNILTKFVLTNKENDDITLIDRFSSMTSPLSTTTDILYTEVDYCLNEVENMMMCKGRQVDVQTSQLSDKHGVLSKCLLINELLREACLNEQHLTGDPEFYSKQYIALLEFKTEKNAEQFISTHKLKFRVISNKNESLVQSLVDPQQKLSNRITGQKNATALMPINQSEKLKNLNSINSQSKVDLYNHQEDYGNISVKSSQIPIQLETAKEIYETLTIKAKLKQKVGMNRQNHVSIQDIDAIMKQVVSVVQTEFMKRFPSSSTTSQQITDGSDY